MPILEFLFGMPVLVFSASAALRCISLVDAPSGWVDQARPGDAAPMVRPEVGCPEQGTHRAAIREFDIDRERREPGCRRSRDEGPHPRRTGLPSPGPVGDRC
jgi:hypothetical protein